MEMMEFNKTWIEEEVGFHGRIWQSREEASVLPGGRMLGCGER
jgi:hypothetical protein